MTVTGLSLTGPDWSYLSSLHWWSAASQFLSVHVTLGETKHATTTSHQARPRGERRDHSITFPDTEPQWRPCQYNEDWELTPPLDNLIIFLRNCLSQYADLVWWVPHCLATGHWTKVIKTPDRSVSLFQLVVNYIQHSRPVSVNLVHNIVQVLILMFGSPLIKTGGLLILVLTLLSENNLLLVYPAQSRSN